MAESAISCYDPLFSSASVSHRECCSFGQCNVDCMSWRIRGNWSRRCDHRRGSLGRLISGFWVTVAWQACWWHWHRQTRRQFFPLCRSGPKPFSLVAIQCGQSGGVRLHAFLITSGSSHITHHERSKVRFTEERKNHCIM